MRASLYIVYHKDVQIPEGPCLRPLRSDRTDGNNIAAKKDYCELRAQYWTWKNTAPSDDEYVGFFHYRRYLDFSRGKAVPLPVKKRGLPYRIVRWPQAEQYTPHKIAQCIKSFDVIAPTWEYTGIKVWDRYPQSDKQRGEDLQMVYGIIKEKYPEFSEAADRYLSGYGEYYGNMYIMRGRLFREYCAWLFDILAEFDKLAITPLPHTNGFLGERLFGIYFTWLQSQQGIRCGELPRLLFSGYDDNLHSLALKKITNCILPPASLCRVQVTKLLIRLKTRGEAHYG